MYFCCLVAADLSCLFIISLSVGETALGEDFELEFVLADARVRPLASVSAEQPRKSRIAATLCDSFFAVRPSPVGLRHARTLPSGRALRKATNLKISGFFPLFHRHRQNGMVEMSLLNVPILGEVSERCRNSFDSESSRKLAHLLACLR
jgi:hypothetical protein